MTGSPGDKVDKLMINMIYGDLPGALGLQTTA